MTQSLDSFLPYLLNQAAEAVSSEFQKNYRGRYGMLRTEWRVLFHLGVYGQMTSKGICDKASIHKTKVSRAVQALENKRYVERHSDPDDRRVDNLALTSLGTRVFRDLQESAQSYERQIAEDLSIAELKTLRNLLRKVLATRAPKGNH